MKIYDHKRRIHRLSGGRKEWYMIPRMTCTNKDCDCQTIHSAIPDNLLPNKHYDAGLIEDVVEGVVTSADPETEDYPCEDTMKNWKSWIALNEANIDGLLRSLGHRLLDLSLAFLSDCSSLLKKIRERISPGWIPAVNAMIYNAGARIPSLQKLRKPGHPLFFAVMPETG